MNHNRKALASDGLRMENLSMELLEYLRDNPEADLTDCYDFIETFETKGKQQ